MTDLDIAKQKIKLENLIPGKKTKKSKYLFVNPCPVCGRNDHFVIVGTHYHSFNNCCERGTAIDWLMRDKGVNFKEATKELLEMANVEERKPSPKDIQQKNKVEMEKRKIDEKFNLLYTNMVFIYKVLKKVEDKNNLGFWLFNIVNIWTDKFIKTDLEKKKETIEAFRKYLKFELKHGFKYLI